MIKLIKKLFCFLLFFVLNTDLNAYLLLPKKCEIGDDDTFACNGRPWMGWKTPPRVSHSFSFLTESGGDYWWHGQTDEKKKLYRTSYGGVRLNYLFYQQLKRNITYFFGSSFSLSRQYWGTSSDFYLNNRIVVPGLSLGLAVDHEDLRFSIGYSFFMERIDEAHFGVEEDSKNLTFTVLSADDIFLSMDYFYLTNWGIRIEAHTFSSFFESPRDSSGSAFNFSLERKTYAVALGVIYQSY